ncbi:MAG: DUF4342 domain-containing protein [Caldilineaceae bacterium]|nr:DUF4342 domain-containing protein [Caldilineaceae bacterium]
MENSQSGTGTAEVVGDATDLQGATTETTEIHEVPGNKVVNFVKHILHEGNVNRIQISRQDGEVLFGLSLTAGVATTAAITLLLPALIGLSFIGLMVSHLRVEVVRKGEATAEMAKEVTGKNVTAKQVTVK